MSTKWSVRVAMGLLGLFVAAGMVKESGLASVLNAANHTPVATGSIHGTVQCNGKVVPNITVTLMTAPARGQAPLLIGTTNTDNSGRYKFESLNPGNYFVQVSTLTASVEQKTNVGKGMSWVVLTLPKGSVPNNK